MLHLQRRLWTAVAVIAGILTCAAVLLPALARPSNCGGNSAAPAACGSVQLSFRMIASEHADKAVSVTDFNSEDCKNFERVTGLSWLPNSKILVTRAKVRTGDGVNRQILAVCDTAFDNVPRRWIGRAPFSHAVVYADGSTGLMRVEDFKRMDLSDFVDVTTIQNKKVEPKH